MTVRTLVLLSAKGGCGKSVTSTALAAELSLRGHRTLLVDGDKQGSATQCALAAADDAPFPAIVLNFSQFGDKLHREVARHLDNYDYVIIDTPAGAGSAVTQSALVLADLAIIPVKTSPPDIWASRVAVLAVQEARRINRKLKAAVLANAVDRTTISRVVVEQLPSLGLPVLKSCLHNRVAYQEAIATGSHVSLGGRSARKAAAEIGNLADEILNMLEEE
ncbi:MAG: cobyrinic acid a,c-diamide synthase [Herminiimonas sp.]|nr:cobyrinic acid a,c-diamide synthase [Herminiimonas sp.]